MISRYQIFLLVSATFLASLDASIIGPALNTFRIEWEVAERDLSWVFSAYFFFYLVGAPLMARVSDLRGRKKVLIASMGIFTAGSLLIAMSGSYAPLLVGRAMQGIGVAGIMPVILAYIGDRLPREKQGMALGMIGLSLGLAFLLGPLLGGLLISYSWRALFYINIPLGIAFMILAYKGLPEDSGRKTTVFDVPGLAIMCAAFGLLAWGINRIDVNDFLASLFSTRCLPYLALATALLPLLYRVESRSPSPALNPKVLRSRNMVLVNILSIGAGVSMVSVFFLPLAASEALHVSASGASVRILPAVAAFVLGSLACGALLSKSPTRTILLGGQLLLASGMSMLAWKGNIPAVFYASIVIMGCGLSGITGPPLRYIVNAEAPDRERGTCQALLLSCQVIGQLIGGSGMGAMSDGGHGALGPYTTAYFALIGVTGLMFLVALGIGPTKDAVGGSVVAASSPVALNTR